MVVRKLDPETGDIVTQGVQFITERDEIAQTIKTRLSLFLGEYFRDITDGTPWFEQILGKQTSRDTAESVLRKRISETQGVIRLVSFSTDFDAVTRKFSVSAAVLTNFGIVEVEQSNG